MQWNQQGFTALFGRDRGRLCGSGSDFALSFGSLRRASRLPRLDRFEMVMCRAQFLPQWKGWKEENPNLYDVPNARHHEELAERLLVPLLE